MPKLVGTSTRVVEIDGVMTIHELAGNVASRDDTLSIAKVTVSQPTAEPWLTLDYDEWICVLSGRLELHSSGSVLTVRAGETAFVAQGERFRPVFPVGGTEYIPVCLPAFKPERCLREEEGVSEVSNKLRELHSAAGVSGSTGTTTAAAAAQNNDEDSTTTDQLYHMCQASLWNDALVSRTAYFPPTFETDGHFTHATAVPARLLATANHFYTHVAGDWLCVELSQTALHQIGIATRFEEPKPVGATATDPQWTDEWQCPHIFGGIPAFLPGVVKQTYQMKRDDQGNFLSIEGLTDR